MGIFNLFSRSGNGDAMANSFRDGVLDGIRAESAREIFPRGTEQIISEGRALRDRLGGSISEEEAQAIWRRSKLLVHIASTKTAARCCESIFKKSAGRLTQEQCRVVYDLACRYLGLNGGSSFELTKHTGKIFQFEVMVDETLDPSNKIGTVSTNERRVIRLAEQHETPYLVAFGHLVARAIICDYPDWGQHMIDLFAKSLKPGITDFGDYADGSPTTYSMNLLCDAFGNRFLNATTWEQVFDFLIEKRSDISQREIIQKLKVATIKAVEAKPGWKMGPRGADQYLTNNSPFHLGVPLIIGTYAHNVKNGHMKKIA